MGKIFIVIMQCPNYVTSIISHIRTEKLYTFEIYFDLVCILNKTFSVYILINSISTTVFHFSHIITEINSFYSQRILFRSLLTEKKTE